MIKKHRFRLEKDFRIDEITDGKKHHFLESDEIFLLFFSG